MQQDVDNCHLENHLDELEDWLVLAQIPNFSVAKLKKLTAKLQLDLSDLRTCSKRSLLDVGFNEQQVTAILQPNTSLIDKSLGWLQGKSNRFLIYHDHPQYPTLLKNISSPPPLIYGYGDAGYLNNHQIAMVGSRTPSHSGKEIAKFFANQLSQCGWTITSGLALGIDGFSHQGALKGHDSTIAVLGTAIDKMYPRRHIKLAEEILANDGLISSEFAPQTNSRAEFFPRRNRIISGLSLGTIIVEAAIKSGSLIMAKYAIEQNREVFAIPGNIQNPMSAGCHHLIQQGAKLVTCIDDINEEFMHLNFMPIIDKEEKNLSQSLAYDKLLDSVDFEVTPLDIVAQRSGIKVADVMSQLLEYELRGLVATVPGGYIKLGEK